MKNEKLKITIRDIHYSLSTIHGEGLASFRSMLHAPCPVHHDSRFTIRDSRLSPPGGLS